MVQRRRARAGSPRATLFVRVVRTEIAGLRFEVLGEIRSLNTKVDNLDRDVQLLMAREFGKDRD